MVVLALQEWISRISEADRKKLAHVLRFDSHPSEVIDLMRELRGRYNFIPEQPVYPGGCLI